MLSTMPLAEMFEAPRTEYPHSTFAIFDLTARYHRLGEAGGLLSKRSPEFISQ
jgi:hypothetical protein